MQNFHIIHVKYLDATDNKMMHIKLTSKRFNTSVTIDNHNGIEDAFIYLGLKDFNIVGKGEFSKTEDIIISDTFKEL